MHARGSLYELETQLTAARRLGYIPSEVETTLLERSTRVIRVVNGLIRRLGSPPPAPGSP